jgi:hypothetical protein
MDGSALRKLANTCRFLRMAVDYMMMGGAAEFVGMSWIGGEVGALNAGGRVLWSSALRHAADGRPKPADVSSQMELN